jgi:subtilisin family serine protease
MTMTFKQQLISLLLLLGCVDTVSAKLRASSLELSPKRNKDANRTSTNMEQNDNNVVRYPVTTTNVTETRYIVSYKSDVGKQVALDLALKVHHIFQEHSVIALELESDGFDLLNDHEHIESIDVDSIWTEQGIIERILEVDEIDEFFNDPKNQGRYLQQKLPYGITMTQANKVSYGKSKAMVCIVDSGVASKHPDFNPSLLSGANRKTKATNSMLYWNIDKRGHGTHISGIVAARSDNNYGVRGMGNIPLYNTRGLDDSGNARESDIIESINQCVAAGSKVINLSLSGTSMSQSLTSVIDNVYAKNVLIVAAAGNNGKRVAMYPASYNKVVS